MSSITRSLYVSLSHTYSHSSSIFLSLFLYLCVSLSFSPFLSVLRFPSLAPVWEIGVGQIAYCLDPRGVLYDCMRCSSQDAALKAADEQHVRSQAAVKADILKAEMANAVVSSAFTIDWSAAGHPELKDYDKDAAFKDIDMEVPFSLSQCEQVGAVLKVDGSGKGFGKVFARFAAEFHKAPQCLERGSAQAPATAKMGIEVLNPLYSYLNEQWLAEEEHQKLIECGKP